MSTISIRPLLPTDLTAMSALGIASKQSWGYDAAQMAIFTRELALTPETVAVLLAAEVASENGTIVGYYTLRQHAAGTVELEHLFVAPDRFHQGIGRLMLQQARKTAVAQGHARLTILADPHAAGFYEKFGARQIGMHQSCIPGRKIPIYELATHE